LTTKRTLFQTNELILVHHDFLPEPHFSDERPCLAYARLPAWSIWEAAAVAGGAHLPTWGVLAVEPLLFVQQPGAGGGAGAGAAGAGGGAGAAEAAGAASARAWPHDTASYPSYGRYGQEQEAQEQEQEAQEQEQEARVQEQEAQEQEQEAQEGAEAGVQAGAHGHGSDYWAREAGWCPPAHVHRLAGSGGVSRVGPRLRARDGVRGGGGDWVRGGRAHEALDWGA